MKKILVTGGAGYIGSAVTQKLIDHKFYPVVFDTFNWGREPLSQVKGDFGVIEGDCRSSKDLVYALDSVDAVIHMAGIVGEPACRINPRAHHTINVEATRNIVNLCTDPEVGLVRDFIFASSCSVYGNVKGIHDAVTEDTVPAPLSEYAHAKLLSERIIQEAATRCPHFHPTILRFTTLFGWAFRPRLDLVTNLFTYKAIHEGKLTIFGEGGQYRSLIHVWDVADAIVHTLMAPRFKRENKIFHVGEESNNLTVAEIAELVKIVLPKTEIIYQKGTDTDQRDYKISCQKIKNGLNWKAKVTVQQGIEEMVTELKKLDANADLNRFRNINYDYK